MIKRGRVTSAKFRKSVKIGDLVTYSWNYGGEVLTRDYRVTEILPPWVGYPAQGRELVMKPVNGETGGILVRELNTTDARLTFTKEV